MSGIMDWALTRSCTIYPYEGRDVYGGVSWGEPVYLECAIRWKRKNEKVRNNVGEELISKYEIRFRDEFKDKFQDFNYIVLGADTTSNLDPIDAGGHEMMFIRDVNGDMVGSDDSYKCWV